MMNTKNPHYIIGKIGGTLRCLEWEMIDEKEAVSQIKETIDEFNNARSKYGINLAEYDRQNG